ncbi:unnamed protein product [Ceutorhynchus assimilis]|uniref:Glutamate dehydrogenase n=1 Tax=Ceutorhynchus assimilis TaxID=467358 RepID=A0A9P0DDI8_9CUCU|nr:unnamed protein product [Ceutorhynchus assimilis]
MQKSASIISKPYARLEYDIPERYRNAFYLANASFFDSTNWFLHSAYEVVFPFLKNSYRHNVKPLGISDSKIHAKLENVIESIDQCNSIIDVRFPLRRENGNLEVIRGFRAHYGESIQNTPCLGGLRIHEDITRDHMKALSVLSAMKNFCLGTGLSGAMGGIKINPEEYSEKELRNMIDLYVAELFKKGYCNHLDVFHPDINTSHKYMKWICEAYATCSGQSINAASTGKPLEYGGIEGYDKAAALGAFKALESLNNAEVLLKTGCSKMGLKNKRFIIQGLGKVGKPLALLLLENGAICVGVRDHDAYLYDAKGIDLKELFIHKEKHNTIEHFGLSKTEFPTSIFTEECDILVLAATQKSLTCSVAKDVKARVILEAADGPITPMAHKILITKSKLVIPDIYACAGSNVISYFEYLRNMQQIGCGAENVLRCSTKIYTDIFNNTSQSQKVIVGGSKTQCDIFKPLDCDFTKNAIEFIYTEVGQEISKNLESLKLGVDVRSAAYAVAIKNVFKIIFERKTDVISNVEI